VARTAVQTAMQGQEPGREGQVGQASQASQGQQHKRRSAGDARSAALPALDVDALAQRWQQQREALREATDRARAPLALLGYECVDLDAVLFAGSAGRAVLGAGEILAGFDRARCAEPLAVLAGGGRGVLLVPRARAAEREAALREEFAAHSGGQLLRTACVPYERTQEAQCLRWLALALADAADAGPLPGVSAGATLARCALCAGPLAAQDAGECARCAAAQRAGASLATAVPGSLAELAEGGRVVVLAAGANLRALLAAQSDLEALGALGLLLGAAVEQAQREAERTLPRAKGGLAGGLLAPRTGGVELRALLAPAHALRYAGDLVRAVQALTSDAARVASALADAAGSQLAPLGLSVGLALGDARIPAWRLAERARAAESAAGRACSSLGWRSALCPDRWVLGEDGALAEAGLGGTGLELRPYSLEATAWRSALHRAAALRRVPLSQRGYGVARESADPEQWNAFCYQVARSPAWRRYLRAAGADWRDPASLLSARADRSLEILMELAP
jgi:hypothetical protein